MRCAGVVLVRQRPGSAKGVVFMTLEDETGIANIVVWPKVMEKYRKEVMGARLILVEGYIQSSPEEVTHLVAQRMVDRSHDLIGLANDALAASIAVPAALRWSSRSTTTAAITPKSPRKKSATPATSASCRRHGIFIEGEFIMATTYSIRATLVCRSSRRLPSGTSRNGGCSIWR